MPGSSTPRLPRTYSPSVFSRKNIQSMFFSGMHTGRQLAYKSSSRRMATLALSILPPMGVVVGPFSSTSQVLISARTSSGMALPQAMRFSMVSPSICLIMMEPAAISSASSFSSTRVACAVMMGPMPSPSITPMVTCFLVEKSVFSPFMFRIRSSCSSSSFWNASQACVISFIIVRPPLCSSAVRLPEESLSDVPSKCSLHKTQSRRRQ